jgi:Txe/YoeB family toxin of Txe-Axe toxin-antitoxin module
MYAIAFEADIVDEFLRIPNFEQFKNKHVKVVIEAEDKPLNTKQSIKQLLASVQNKPFQQIQDPLAWQQAQRDEWS